MSIEPTTCPTCGAAVRVAGHTTLHYEPVPSNTAAAPGLTVTTLGHNTNPLQPIEEALALSIEATAARLAQELADARAALADLLDAAERQRQGNPLGYEEWRLPTDAARRIVEAGNG